MAGLTLSALHGASMYTADLCLLLHFFEQTSSNQTSFFFWNIVRHLQHTYMYTTEDHTDYSA